jgi:hypothetical protein
VIALGCEQLASDSSDDNLVTEEAIMENLRISDTNSPTDDSPRPLHDSKVGHSSRMLVESSDSQTVHSDSSDENEHKDPVYDQSVEDILSALLKIYKRGYPDEHGDEMQFPISKDMFSVLSGLLSLGWEDEPTALPSRSNLLRLGRWMGDKLQWYYDEHEEVFAIHIPQALRLRFAEYLNKRMESEFNEELEKNGEPYRVDALTGLSIRLSPYGDGVRRPSGVLTFTDPWVPFLALEVGYAHPTPSRIRRTYLEHELRHVDGIRCVVRFTIACEGGRQAKTPAARREAVRKGKPFVGHYLVYDIWYLLESESELGTYRLERKRTGTSAFDPTTTAPVC